MKNDESPQHERDHAWSPHDVACDDVDAIDRDFLHESPTLEMSRAHANTTILLGFLSPGTFLSLEGKSGLGAVVNLVIASLFLLGPWLSVHTGLFPIPLFFVAMVVCVSVWIFSICRVFFVTSPRMRTHWAQTSFAFLTFWLPLMLCFYVSSTSILQRTWMGNDTMRPELLRGDFVLVDRHAFEHRDPSYGDLVLVEESVRDNNSTRTRAFFSRIIACPGDRVQLNGVHPVVNGESLDRYLQRDEQEVYDRPIVIYELPYQTSTTDPAQEPENWYPILHSNQLIFSQTNSVTLEPGYYYVLEDNRDSSRERVRTSYGAIVHQREIHGQPRYVIYNNLVDNGWERYGLRLR